MREPLHSSRAALLAASFGFLAILEQSLLQAASALTGERQAYIASFLKNSLTRVDLEHADEARLLELFGSVDDAEVIILKYYALRATATPDAADAKFYKKHQSALEPAGYWAGLNSGVSEDERRSDPFHRRRHENLASLGLIQLDRHAERSQKEKELKEMLERQSLFFATRSFHELQWEISALGTLLIDWIEDPDSPRGEVGSRPREAPDEANP